MKPFDESGIFRHALGGDGLRRVAVRSAGVTVLSQGLAFAVQMGATVVLARLLMPRDFGLVAMVSTLSLLLMNCGLNGFTEAVIQRNQINHGLVSNLFWINAGLGVLLALGFAAGGPLLARFYGDPRVAHVAAAMSIAIFITTVSVQHLALLKRAMQFALVSANDIVARTVSVIVSILLAWAGWGYWALVAGAVALPLATSIGAWILCRWVPGLPSRRNGTVPMVRFAMSTYGRFTASYFTNNLDNLLVGWRFGAAPLGFYKKAYDLFVLPTNQLSAPLTSVAVSTLSRLDPNSTQYRHYFLRALSALAFVGFGLGAGLTLVGGDLIRLLLGPGWEEAGRIFRFFGPGIGIMLLYFTHGWIHLSIGRADRWLRWGMVELSVTASLFLVGLTRGPIGIAVAWVVSYWILTIPALWYAGRPIRLGIGPMVTIVWKYVLASLIAGCTSAAIVHGIPEFVAATDPVAVVARIVTTSLLFATLYLSVVVLVHRGWEPLYEVASLLRDIVPWDKFARLFPGADGTSSNAAVAERIGHKISAEETVSEVRT